MGIDTTAITIIGIRIPIKKLFTENQNYIKECYCPECEESYCSECSNEIDLDSKKYQVYQEHCFENYSDHLFICIEKNEKDGPRGYQKDTVEKASSLETLIEKREELKKLILEKGILSDEEFDNSFGIYTLIEASY